MDTKSSEASNGAATSAPWLEKIAWNEAGLAPAVAQEHATGRILMCAWMNREALDISLREGWATYWSRSRQRLWRKGEQSGHKQKIRAIRMDCDCDTLLLQVEQADGIACHTGRPSCFFHRLKEQRWAVSSPPETVLGALDRVLQERLQQDPQDSYVARLHHAGLDSILRKLGEESTETLLAAKAASAQADAGALQALVHETADLWFHSLVMLAHLGCDSGAVLHELQQRMGVSGLAEKRTRSHRAQQARQPAGMRK